MYKESVEKVEGGKLVRIKLDYDSVINKIQITGDFFLHPEECIKDIEIALTSSKINEAEETLKNKINAVVEQKNIQMVGITADVIARLIKQIVSSE